MVQGRIPWKVTPKEEDEMARMYTEDGMSLRQVADEFLVTHARVHQILQKRGVDTAKTHAGSTTRVCAGCGKEFVLYRSRVRKTNYCCRTCWRATMEVLGLHQRMARGYVENIMGKPLPHGAVVHFIDDDWSRILRDNLKVFRTQAAHLREHGVAEEA